MVLFGPLFYDANATIHAEEMFPSASLSRIFVVLVPAVEY